MLASALLGESPPVLEVRLLVRLAGLFGINENRARVALSRMAARGEVVADGAGRYALAGHLLERSRRLAASRTAQTAPYDGSWHVAVVSASGDDPATRRARRAALRAARLGELRDGTWLRPANLDVVLDTQTAGSVTRLRAMPDGDARALAAAAFDLEGWARRARALHSELTDDASGPLAEGFLRNAEVVRHLQRDPLVPAELLAPDWPGPALRARFDRFDAAYRTRLAAAHRAATTS